MCLRRTHIGDGVSKESVLYSSLFFMVLCKIDMAWLLKGVFLAPQGALYLMMTNATQGNQIYNTAEAAGKCDK